MERNSPCKINLLLNVLGKRADGFHELEMVMHPVHVYDTLEFKRRTSDGVELTCSNSALPVDSTNLVYRAATRFMEAARIAEGVRIHLEKRIPMAAGLGGGSSNAAHTLLGLNELFGHPLSGEKLHELAAGIGSDVPFFLQSEPALVLGRGERILPHAFFPALSGLWLVLVHPGFGISTPWAYGELKNFPQQLTGRRGRAEAFVRLLETGPASEIGRELYNALEAPALRKYPVLALYQEFFRSHGAIGALMSGSGSTTFAIVNDEGAAREMIESFENEFGRAGWVKAVAI